MVLTCSPLLYEERISHEGIPVPSVSREAALMPRFLPYHRTWKAELCYQAEHGVKADEQLPHTSHCSTSASLGRL